MPDKFSVYITDKLLKLGYESTSFASSTLFSSVRFKPQNTMQPFSVIYLKTGMHVDTDALLYLFQNIPDHLLIVVDSGATGKDVATKQWFRALHALYYGRVYVWDGVGILPVHYDRKLDQFSQGKHVEVKSLRFERVDCLYSGFKGLYNVVLLNDRKFWTTDGVPPAPDNAQSNYEEFWKAQYAASDEAQQAGGGESYGEPWAKNANPSSTHTKAKGNAQTDARKEEHRRREQAQRDEKKRREQEARTQRERDDVFSDFREAFERNKQHFGAQGGGAYDPNKRPQHTRGGVTGDKWFMLIWSDGTIDGAKKAYRALARQYHPDTNKALDANEIMQAINSAYEKAMKIHG